MEFTVVVEDVELAVGFDEVDQLVGHVRAETDAGALPRGAQVPADSAVLDPVLCGLGGLPQGLSVEQVERNRSGLGSGLGGYLPDGHGRQVMPQALVLAFVVVPVPVAVQGLGEVLQGGRCAGMEPALQWLVRAFDLALGLWVADPPRDRPDPKPG